MPVDLDVPSHDARPTNPDVIHYRLEVTVMDKALTSDMSSDDKAIVLAIEAASAEIGQAIEQMKKDQAEIERLKAETRVMLNELMVVSSLTAGVRSTNP